MSIPIADISALISLGAFGTAVYGILERGTSAKRQERIRLTEIIQSMAEIRSQLVEMVSRGVTLGDSVEVLSAKLEVLNAQALNLVRKHELEITSAELRELAMSLEQASSREDAESMWLLARDCSRAEGKTQNFRANRGYAYFLFRDGRQDEARDILEETLARYPANNDRDRLSHAETLRHWINWEVATQKEEARDVPILNNKIKELANACSNSMIKEMISQYILRPASTELEG